jgi:hypothetical protein
MAHYAEIQTAPASQVTPRGALIAADLFARLMKRFQHDDTPARVHDVAMVRELAHQVESSDPSFAADLYAAAARHEDLGN